MISQLNILVLTVLIVLPVSGCAVIVVEQPSVERPSVKTTAAPGWGVPIPAEEDAVDHGVPSLWGLILGEEAVDGREEPPTLMPVSSKLARSQLIADRMARTNDPAISTPKHIIAPRGFDPDDEVRQYALVLYKPDRAGAGSNNRIFCESILAAAKWRTLNERHMPEVFSAGEVRKVAPLYWFWDMQFDKDLASTMPAKLGCQEILGQNGPYDFERAADAIRQVNANFGGGLIREPGPFVVGFGGGGVPPSLILDMSCVDPNKFDAVANVLVAEFVLAPENWRQSVIDDVVNPNTLIARMDEMGVRIVRVLEFLRGKEIKERKIACTDV